MRKPPTPSPIADLSSAVAAEAFYREVDAAAQMAAGSVASRVAGLGAIPADRAQGFYAEVYHAETFNLDAVLNRMKGVSSGLPKSNGLKSADYVVRDGGRVVKGGSAKYYKSGRDSVNAQKGYGDQERLVPGGQIEDAKKYIDEQIPKDLAKGGENRAANAEELTSIKGKLVDRIRHRRGTRTAESQELGRAESERDLKAVRRGEPPALAPQYDAAVVVREALRSGAIAAGVTVGVAVAPRVWDEVAHRVRAGEFRADAWERVSEGVEDYGSRLSISRIIDSSTIASLDAGSVS